MKNLSAVICNGHDTDYSFGGDLTEAVRRFIGGKKDSLEYKALGNVEIEVPMGICVSEAPSASALLGTIVVPKHKSLIANL